MADGDEAEAFALGCACIVQACQLNWSLDGPAAACSSDSQRQFTSTHSYMLRLMCDTGRALCRPEVDLVSCSYRQYVA